MFGGHPPTAIGYPPTAIGYPPTAKSGVLDIPSFFFFFITAPLGPPLDPPPPHFKGLAKFSFGPLANQKISWAPLAPINVDQKFLWHLKKRITTGAGGPLKRSPGAEPSGLAWTPGPTRRHQPLAVSEPHFCSWSTDCGRRPICLLLAGDKHRMEVLPWDLALCRGALLPAPWQCALLGPAYTGINVILLLLLSLFC